MKLKIFISFIIFALTFLEAKPPQITERDVSLKVEEILKAHAAHKKLTPELGERILKNFIEELDPYKVYFLESEIQNWLYPAEPLLQTTIEGFKTANFSEFEKIHEVMIKCIERRNNLETELEASEMPQDVKPEEFKDMPWTNSQRELLSRLVRITALQLDTAKKLNEENRDKITQRFQKCRKNREAEITATTKEERKQLTLSYIMKATCAALDSHTNYFTPQEASQFMIQVQQRLSGIGAQLKDSLNGFSIMRIIEGGPAEKSHLKINDKIIAVNKEPVVGMDITEAVELIRGEKGSSVILTILREGKENKELPSEKFDIEIIRGEVVLEDSRFEAAIEPYGDGSIAHIKLFSFYQDPQSSSASDLKNAIENYKKKHNLKAIVLDLRSNSGGLLPQAVAVTGLFISKGVVVSIKDNTGLVQHLRNIESNMIWDGPLVVLTNKGSASAAEIVAQTLQDYGRAILIGDQYTFGKGSFQTFTLDSSKQNKINPQGEYKVTRGRYYTVSGKSPQLKGVAVDIEVPGLLSELDIGEKFAKYPLENDEIPPNFEDDLSDIPPLHRKRISLLYKHNMQQKIATYTQYMDILKKNSDLRLTSNKNYQNFLKEIKNKNYEAEPIEIFGKSDLQLQEAFNIVKDLVFLIEINDKHFE